MTSISQSKAPGTGKVSPAVGQEFSRALSRQRTKLHSDLQPDRQNFAKKAVQAPFVLTPRSLTTRGNPAVVATSVSAN